MATDEAGLTYTVYEFAAMMRISPSAVYRLCRAGEIPHFRLGTTIRISRHWADELLAGRQSLHASAGV